MAAVQGLLKKHDTFQLDLQVHEQRIDDLQKQGNEVNLKEFFIYFFFYFTVNRIRKSSFKKYRITSSTTFKTFNIS